MTDTTRSSSDFFNNEDSNTTANPHIDHIMTARLNRRGLLLGGMGAAATSLFGAGALTGCATASTGAGTAAGMTAPLSSLGFAAVGKRSEERRVGKEGRSRWSAYD